MDHDEQTVVAKVKELTQPYSPVDPSDIRKLFLMLAEEIDELKKIHTGYLTNTDKETDWTDVIADEFFDDVVHYGVAYTSRKSFDAALRNAVIRGYDLARDVFKNTKKGL
jgi:hypothetical protein